MSDPYIPTRGDTLGNPTVPGGTPVGLSAGASVGANMPGRGADPYRNDLHSSTAKPVQSGGGGFGTGALVAMVFVVVAIIAAVLFSFRDEPGNQSGVAPAATTVPDAGSTGTPVTVPDGAPDSTPDTTPAPVEPDTAPDLVPEPAPGGATPDTAAPATP